MNLRTRAIGRVVLLAALLVLALALPSLAAAAGPCTTVCYADAVGGNDANDGDTPATAFKTIQKAIDTVQVGGEVHVLPGSYDETATNRFVLGTNGPHQFGLFIAKNGLTIQGVTAADVAITDPSATQADITTNATNNFGFSGIFVEGDDVTIAGLEIGPNTPGENKTIEIIGDNFTLKDCLMTGDGIDGAYPYFDDWRYDSGTSTAHVESYTVTNNIFGPGSQIAISSGAGASGPVSGRQITDNEFTMNAGQNWPSISFNGDGTTVPWFTYPVGGAVITGNTFTNNAVGGMHIRTRGVADDSEFDWASYWYDNTYNKAVVAGVNPPNDVRAWSYTTSYTFNDVRVIGADIQPEIDHAQPGDTVLVKAGTYPESPNVNKSLTLTGEDGRDATTIELQTGPTYLGALTIDGAIVTVQGFTIKGFDAVGPGLASTNVWVTTRPDVLTLKDNRFLVGQVGAGSNGDDGFGLLTTYTTSSDVTKLTVEDNLFLPLGAAGGQRAFYINPGVYEFIFRGNDISGEFAASSITQAKSGLVENNTLTGTGTSRGFGTWGYPDPTFYGATLFQGNTISDVVNGITIFGSENVTVTKNVFTGNDRAVYVAEDDPFDLTTIHINRNSIDGNTMGIENWYETEVDGTCNWWGDASGPSGEGPGMGDPAGMFVDFTPWLYSDDLDGPCYVGATISIDKVAPGGGATQFTFDVSWSADHVILTDGDPAYVTTPPLPAGNYSITEINFPTGWSLDNATCVGPDEISGDPANLTVSDGDAWVCTFTDKYTPPPANTCPVTAASNRWTDILGIGMGSTKAHKVQAKINIPNYTNLVGLYGQLVAKDTGQAKYVRFIMPGKNNYVQVNAITAPISNQFGNFWYGATLPTAGTKYVTGRWFLKPIGVKGHIPRALVLYPTYNDPAHTYVNVWDTFTPAEGQVDWRPGWTQMHQVHVPIAAPLGPTTFHVEVAVADNDKDARPVWVTVAAGNVTQTQKPTNPDKGDQLNLLNFTLANVPAGTSEIVITIYSPSVALDGVEGDSATLVGMAANYVCTPIAPIP